MRTADVVVIGAGAMGGAAAFQLAKRGVKTVVIDRYEPPHELGSTHGISRLTREAIGEGNAYVPLAMRSHAIWREIEAETGEDLLLLCGMLVISRERSAPAHGKRDFLKQTISAARRFGIPHETLTPNEVRARYPQVALKGDEESYFEPGGGLVYPERCVAAQLRLASRNGAELRLGETVLRVQQIGERVRVTTDRDSYEADQAVLAAGPWIGDLVGEVAAPFVLHRQVMFWYAPEDEAAFRPGRFPAFIWFHGEGVEDYFYGFPALEDGRGVKVAMETYRTRLSRPESVERAVSPAEADAMYDAHVRGRFPGIARQCRDSRACIYTVAPDSDFVIDRHPEQSRLLIVSPCSGHGFKHSAAIGESVAELVSAGRSSIDLSAFALARFKGASASAAVE
jgi:sarcosine oxidase